MTAREAAKVALSNGKARSIRVIYDEGYDLFRVEVVFRHDGKEYVYGSKPFCGFNPQDFACEIAKRMERLGLSRSAVIDWIKENMDLRGIDCDVLFVKGLTRTGRIPPTVMSQLRSMIHRNATA